MITEANTDTHDVLNQAPPIPDRDAFSTDAPLVEAVRRHGASSHLSRLTDLGRSAGAESWRLRGAEA